MATKKTNSSKMAANKAPLAEIEEHGMLDYTRNAIKLYGAAVLEDRAIVDYRDGLKPVQRRSLWAMYSLGLHGHKRVLKKSARVVGEVLGKFHPHGDKSVYDAMVNQVSSNSVPTIFGDGNWGDPITNDEAAAMRYTECHLSEYSDKVFFDKRYTSVIEYVPNFDGTEKEPVILPALLPNVLVNGAFGIAVGGTSHLPSYHVDGIKKLVKKALAGKPITVKDCVKNLEFNYRTGGQAIIDEGGEGSYLEHLESFYKTGVGSVWFQSNYTWDAKSRSIRIDTFPPNFNLAKTIATITDIDWVTEVEDLTSIENGVCYQIYFKKSNEWSDEQLVDGTMEYFVSKLNYRCNVTERYYDKEANETRATFRSTTVPALIESWTKWRVELEKDSLKYWTSVVNEELVSLKLLLLAIQNRALIIKSLDEADSEAFLMSKLSITIEQAKTIMDMKIRTLKRLNGDDVKAKIKDAETRRKELMQYLKNPAAKVMAEINAVYG